MIGSREEYKKLLKGKILGKENCPFCGPTLDVEMILWEGKFWRIMRNKFPYTGDENHLMAVPKIHKIFSTEITSEEWQELVEVHNFMKNFFGDQSYFSFTRETFLEWGDRSVEHWHMHFVSGSIKWKFLRKMLELQGFPITQELKF